MALTENKDLTSRFSQTCIELLLKLIVQLSQNSIFDIMSKQKCVNWQIIVNCSMGHNKIEMQECLTIELDSPFF